MAVAPSGLLLGRWWAWGFSGDKTQSTSSCRGYNTQVCENLREGHGCNTADCDAHDPLHLWGRWDVFIAQDDYIYINIHLLSRIWDINALPVYVTALLRKSTATDFLQKVREKRSSECFPGGCSTEDNETGELMEVDVGYVSSPSTVLSFAFDPGRGFPTANMYPVHLLKFSFWVPEYFHFMLFYIFYFTTFQREILYFSLHYIYLTDIVPCYPLQIQINTKYH